MDYSYLSVVQGLKSGDSSHYELVIFLFPLFWRVENLVLRCTKQNSPAVAKEELRESWPWLPDSQPPGPGKVKLQGARVSQVCYTTREVSMVTPCSLHGPF